MRTLIIIFSLMSISACSSDYNSSAVYGETGLPKNCRAIVQTNIDAYKDISRSNIDDYSKLDEIDGLFDSLERNCGADGYSWEE